jgi:hypothetical protein
MKTMFLRNSADRQDFPTITFNKYESIEMPFRTFQLSDTLLRLTYRIYHGRQATTHPPARNEGASQGGSQQDYRRLLIKPS